MKVIRGTMLGAALLLTGCGDNGESEGKSPMSRAKTDWGAEACKVLTADAAARATGVAVSQATSSSNARVGDNTVSTCSYATSDGIAFTVALRYSPGGSLAESVAGLKSQPDMTGPIEDIPVKAGKAFWAPKLKRLTYLPDDHRMVSVVPPGVRFGGTSDADDVLKQRAMALAEAAANA